MKGAIRAFGRMVRAVATRRYRPFPWRTVIGLALGLAYLLFPLDFIPDAIFAIGLLDDAAVLALIARAVKRDVEAFRAWEAGG